MFRRLLLLIIALAFISADADDFPPIPPLPPDDWPPAEAAVPFARELMARVPADALARKLVSEPNLIPPVLRNLGTALMSNDPALLETLPAYLSAVARFAARATNPLRSSDVRLLASEVIVDPLRYRADAAFRQRINTLLPGMAAPMPRPVARAILSKLTESAALDFDTAEAIAVAAKLAPRSSVDRRGKFDRSKIEMPDDLRGPIQASVFSLHSHYLTPREVRPFLSSVRNASPKRGIIVVGDTLMRKALAADWQRLHITFIDDFSRSFTLWPRDPFIVTRSADGGVVFVNRPNVQPGREEDQNMVRAIVQGLPPDVDAAWNGPRWTVAPTPFHNGHILLTATTVWISIHSVEPRALEILGVDRVPVETFNERAGIDRYIGAVRQAAAELQDFYRRPVRFVHALPGPPANASDLMKRLGGGAGIDLDSIVTILPRATGQTNALVGHIALGIQAARRASLEEWSAVREAYGFRGADPRSVRDQIIEAQGIARTAALQQFLDEVAAELQRDGMTVRRLPLLNVPATLLARDDVPKDFEFLMTWNNVVLETRGGIRRAEGFASLLPSADRFARQAFATSGYVLDLYPPLIPSIVLGGGYRCASNHVRPR